jgi:hypothetical protein
MANKKKDSETIVNTQENKTPLITEGKSGGGKMDLAKSLNGLSTRQIFENSGYKVYCLDPWGI